MSASNHAGARRAAALLLGLIRVGCLTIVEDGRRRTFGSGAAPAATIDVHDPAFWPMLFRGSRGLAESYARGWWDSPDLVAVIRLAARNAVLIDRVRSVTAPLWAPRQRVRALLRRPSRRRSRRDVTAHYDLGNELFARMLDPTMMYSCALFERPGMTLEEASVAKLERVCERLDLGPDDHVVEIGTGWGGFAVHAAATRGCRVTTTTISREQHDFAIRRVRRAGLEDHVTVLLRDYRDLHGRFDKLVSIEMIEAVGWQQIGRFFARCAELLTPHGVMLLQAITIDDRAYEVEKASRSFIKEYIFPGGCLPSMEVIMRQVARRTDLQAVGLEDLTPSYVETLRRWRHNFASHARQLDALGYDERFRRIWTLYLAYCEGGFAERRICDVQLLLAKPRWAVKTAAGAGSAAIAAAG
ncbi:MAG TPA: cyclopropane-fatty-acyl-phospholipid synthase family protein [Solirubrobacteraceae bacterium]|jgi:cyclopropane-fatty-acyl-phospholipid synthase|nr:cyclopropane-fatty-acyl-phospholipid synthase family protein [Solirubrobacteraceae bacterium]